MARPRDSMAIKELKGNSHLTQEEISEGYSNEIYAANGEIKPPTYLKREAKKHFIEQATYMQAVNKLSGKSVYGSVDIASLALMSLSYQKSLEYMKEEQDANDSDSKDKAARKRISEERAYREFAKMLKLNPGNRVDIAKAGVGDAGGEPEF